MSTQTVEIQPEREVAKCTSCGLNQFVITSSWLCRRCNAQLPFNESMPPVIKTIIVREEKRIMQRKYRIKRLRNKGGLVKYYRHEFAGITQIELARRIGINARCIISRIEHGKHPLSIHMAIRITRALGLPERVLVAPETIETYEERLELFFKLLTESQQKEVCARWRKVLEMK